MAEHTPGDWHLHKVNDDGVAYYVHADYVNGALGKRHHSVATVDSLKNAEQFGNLGTPEGNAHLIIAAPDLLKACEAVASDVAESGNATITPETFRIVRDAIENAEGAR